MENEKNLIMKPKGSLSDSKIEVDAVGKEEEFKNKAVLLFEKILEDFYSEDFTERDIRDAFSKLSGDKGYRRKRELQYLIEEGLLDYDEENKNYKINHASPKVAIIMENGLNAKNN
ncbi:MAG TPA: hypothetical protein ENJ27_02130 [Candidatus Moranbacteria bacterium]|nr:hypothetical protein [Candidatus Moranbacteria bacterium]